MKKLVYISSIAAPHQVKLCRAMQEYFDTEFWYYDTVGKRASWWNIELDSKNRILPDVKNIKSRYFTTSHIKWLREVNPDILMLGGFSVPANYFAYRWAKKNNKKAVVFTERSRDNNGNLRRRSMVWRILKWLYNKVDLVMVSEEDIVPQFRDEFKFGDKVVASRYAADIDVYLSHPKRESKNGYTYMFPNRLTEKYNPLGALEIFTDVVRNYPESKMVMNALGEQREACEKYIIENEIEKEVEFLDNIKSWDQLHLEYRRCDIMIFPAIASNGNFTIIEGMASGMGIIISDKILGVGNYISHNENGYRIPPQKELFIKAIKSFIDNPELINKFAVVNRRNVKHLGSKGTAKLYYTLLSNI